MSIAERTLVPSERAMSIFVRTTKTFDRAIFTFASFLKAGHSVFFGEQTREIPAVKESQPAIVVPIQVRDEMVGVINIASEKPGSTYDEEDLRALQVFAENVGSCIRHAEQAEWMRQIIQRHTAGAAESTSPTKERFVPTA